MLTFEEIDLKSIHGSDKKGWGVNLPYAFYNNRKKHIAIAKYLFILFSFI